MEKARGNDSARKTVAVIGDSTFIHSGITGLIDIVYNKGTSTVIILDNSITGMTGHQDNPTTGFTIKGEPTRQVNLVKLCQAVGIDRVRVCDPFELNEFNKVLKEEIGDLIIFDVGGATTDLHSVTGGSSEINSILISPEPVAKRTVEGDLGVYVNVAHVVEKIGMDNLKKEFPDAEELLENYKPIPVTDREKQFVERLTKEAVLTSLERHAGKLRYFYTASGKKTVAEGKDLTAIQYIIGTGGTLTRLSGNKQILELVKTYGKEHELYPTGAARVLIDEDYILSSLGVLSKSYLYDALYLMKKSLRM
jgi:uncharacterized protein (TIGR01319 family)